MNHHNFRDYLAFLIFLLILLLSLAGVATGVATGAKGFPSFAGTTSAFLLSEESASEQQYFLSKINREYLKRERIQNNITHKQLN